MSDSESLFGPGGLPAITAAKEKNFRSIRFPVWSEEKALLIQEYLKLFTFITKHGNYIDGFAAPQRRNLAEICSAKLVLETEPKRLRNFWLCDIDRAGIELLEEVSQKHRSKTRRIEVLQGDFNKNIENILLSRFITTRTATFALLDQRTFECEWRTVERIARRKPEIGPCDTKIEIFYFLATGWLDRSIAAVKASDTACKLERWWGQPDWRELRGMQGIPRANLVAKRFQDEFGYRHARPYAIHNRKRHGRTMYHMIHATDHDEAPTLMLRAYRKISGREDIDFSKKQIDMSELWEEVKGDAGEV